MKKIAALYRASYSGLSPSSWLLSLVMLINRSGTMVLPFMTLYLTTRLNFNLSQAGMIMGIFGAGAICGGFIGGRLCTLFGFYNVQLMTLCGGGLMFLVLGQMSSFPAICAVTFLLSVINESFRPANYMAIAHYSKDENRTRSYSLNRLAINMGWALGGSLGGFLAAHNYHLLFILDGCTNIFAAILLRVFLAPAKQETGKEDQPVKSTRAARMGAYRDKPYLFFNLMVVLYAYTFFQLFSTLPVYLKKVLHLSEQFIGLTMTINGIIVALVEMVLIFKLERKRHALAYSKWGALLIGLSFVNFNIFPAGGTITTWLSVAMVLALTSTLLVTFGEMLSMPFMNTFWVGRTNNENRGGYAGLYTVSWALAQVLGWWSGPAIADKLGFTFLWWMIGFISLTASLGFWALQRLDNKTGI